MKERIKERYERNIKRIASSTLANFKCKAEEIPTINYFINILYDSFVEMKESDEEYIGTYCIMIPDEIIYGFGYRPLRLCASHSTAALVGDEIVPRDACPVIKASLAFQYMDILPIYKQCKCAIIPMTCEGKRKSAELMAEYLPVIPMPFYVSKNASNFEKNVYDIKGLIVTLENLSGRKFKAGKMLQAYKEINYAQEQAYILSSYLQMEDPPVDGSTVMLVLNSFCYSNPLLWGRNVEKLNKSIEEKLINREKRKNKKPRIYLAGSPISFPNYKVLLLLEQLGGQIVGDESCLSGRMLYDPVIPKDESEDSMIRALVARYISACTCPVFDDVEDRKRTLFEKVKKTEAEGIIYHVLRGCIPYDFELSMIEKEAKELDIPILRIETDFSEEDIEQLKIRFEGFVEMIEQRRREKNGKILSRV
ncbi:2-hydroxyglutaryl-CoA dehydratase subunit D [Clostridium bornimense]|uniref:2-hydroxyglutaryl-CoA dehydratase subunit D n=1 Tax=Clostridium bornimense TaxID=1216932 RepID=W6S0L2_9CLOT|nr:2-hydroxyacyl-CoA dehydratase family protein [Clostridium bornimense]CDM70298.1 2-hydroxyglutaryl-CoA dehydratase subunit D [Clostridium bornimense]